MKGVRTSGSLMSSPSKQHRRQRVKTPLAAKEENKRLRVRCQGGSPVPRHPEIPPPPSQLSGGGLKAPRPGIALCISIRIPSPSQESWPASQPWGISTGIPISSGTFGNCCFGFCPLYREAEARAKIPPTEIKNIPVPI